MRWYLFGSLAFSWRIKFLIGLIIVAVILACVLIFIEIKMKRKKARENATTKDKLAIEKVRRFLEGDRTSKEKLDYIDRMAKEYFKEVYGMSMNSSYSVLIKDFEKRRRTSEVAFCKSMFTSYYLDEKLDDKKVVALGGLLIDLKEKRRVAKDVSKVPSFMDKVEKVVDRMVQLVSRVGEAIRKRRELKMNERKIREGVRQKAIRQKMVMEKQKIAADRAKEVARVLEIKKERALEVARANILKSERRYRKIKGEEKKIVCNGIGKLKSLGVEGGKKIFTEFGAVKKDVGNFLTGKNVEGAEQKVPEVVKEKNLNVEEEGIAVRIMKKEKNRLDKAGVFVMES